MKKIIFVFTFFAVALFSTNLAAQTILEKNKAGEFKISKVDTNGFEKIAIIETENDFPFNLTPENIESVKQAVENPGVAMELVGNTRFLKLILPFYQEIEYTSGSAVFESGILRIKPIEPVEYKRAIKPNYISIYPALLIIFMVIVHSHLKKPDVSVSLTEDLVGSGMGLTLLLTVGSIIALYNTPNKLVATSVLFFLAFLVSTGYVKKQCISPLFPFYFFIIAGMAWLYI